MYNLSGEPEINAQVLPNTELLRITVAHSNPVIAREAANSLASIVIRRSQEIDNRLNMITVVDSAVTPKSPALSRMIILAFGGIIGLIGGFGLAFLFEYLERRLYTPKQIEQFSESNILGSIPSVRERESILLNDDCPQFYQVAFQNLRTNILMQNHKYPLKTLLVTSANPGEGKSTILVNLAISISRMGNKVVMVDADLRKPKLHTLCQVPNEVGLRNILEEGQPFIEAFQWIDDDICVIPAGPPPADPPSLLMSGTISSLIEGLSEKFGYLFFDAPAILAAPDAKLLADHVDGLILVVSGTTATEETITDVNKSLRNLPVRSLGIVVNKANLNPNEYYYRT